MSLEWATDSYEPMPVSCSCLPACFWVTTDPSTDESSDELSERTVFVIHSFQVGPEYARFCGIEALEPLGIYLPGDTNYPGGRLFDPLGLSQDPAASADLKVKEIKHGRLAMVAWLGFYAQAAVTQQGPVANLVSFIADPAHNNLLAYLPQQLAASAADR